MANTPNLDLKKMEGDPKATNFNHKEYYENNFEKVDAAVGAKPTDLTTTAKTIIPAIIELESDKVDKVEGKGLSTNDFDNTYKQKIDIDIPAQLAEIEQDKAEKTDIGLLSGLLTTTKTSIVNAINELFNSKANKTQEAWITPTLLNGWYAIRPNEPPQYMKDTLGFVHFRGVIAKGASATSNVAFRLPFGYLPNNDTTFSMSEIKLSSATVALSIFTNGNVDFAGAVLNSWYGISSITFKAV